MKRLEIKVFGRVQGVFFRAFTRRNARALGLAGTVENVGDGSVQIFAEGDEQALKEFLQRIKAGSYFSHVESSEDSWGDAKGGFSGFQII